MDSDFLHWCMSRNLTLRAAAVALLLLAPVPALGHTGQTLAPHDLWQAWTFDPLVVFALLLGGLLYAVGLARLWSSSRRGAGVSEIQAACFGIGWLAVAVALVSPLHALGSVLFSAHMTQHEVLISLGAPLIVVGRPIVPFLWAFPRDWSRRLGTIAHGNVVSSPWRMFSRPSVAFALHAVALWAWHLPGPYQATITSSWMHALQHSSFVFTALLFWWSILSARGEGLGRGAGIFYLFGTALQTGALGALLAFAPSLWYPAYAATTGAWGLSPLEDQQLGGLIMWIPGSIPYLVAGLVLFAGWLRESETRSARREAAMRLTRIAATIVLVVTAAGCDRASGDRSLLVSNADVDRGQIAIRKYGCGSCHMIPGIGGAEGLVGPPLGQIASRVYIAGVLPNEPDNMIKWIENPPAIDPKTAMPNVGVTPRDARDIAAYLYTLR
ncbi:MAG TPA: cytochrome c oxidase assembly protein [Gemmatimonadaceae bacterium]|nr:cytochrome c oxidase assembly protein [Gemmatimonadaceae bacterium]